MTFHSDASPAAKQAIANFHVHTATETCPTCDQLIPPDRIKEVLGRQSARDAEKEKSLRSFLQKQFETDKAQADAKAQSALNEVRQQAAAQVDAAREEERKKAETVANEKIAVSENARKALEQSLGEKTEALTAVQTAAVERESQLRLEAAELQKTAVAEAVAKQAEASKASEATLQEKFADAELKRTNAEKVGETLKQQLTDVTKTKDAEIADIKKTAAADAVRIKQEAADAAQAAMALQLASKDNLIAAANAKAAEAEGKIKVQASEHELAMANNTNAVREAMEKAKDEAVSAEKARAFEENQKLANKVSELQRALEKKSNDELGEGAEVDLYEALKAEFPDDGITRVKKGQPGADIIHIVKHNGQECGKIVYDSKNHNAYRSEHVTKLREDQLAENAEHSILSTQKFPAGTRQLHQQDGVLLANPARILAVATMLRQHLINAHGLRMSASERETKIGSLYNYITSERFTHQLQQVDKHAEEMLTLQVAEMKQHKKTWETEGEILKKIQKANAAIANDVGAIIGTTEILGDAEEEYDPAEGVF